MAASIPKLESAPFESELFDGWTDRSYDDWLAGMPVGTIFVTRDWLVLENSRVTSPDHLGIVMGPKDQDIRTLKDGMASEFWAWIGAKGLRFDGLDALRDAECYAFRWRDTLPAGAVVSLAGSLYLVEGSTASDMPRALRFLRFAAPQTVKAWQEAEGIPLVPLWAEDAFILAPASPEQAMAIQMRWR